MRERDGADASGGEAGEQRLAGGKLEGDFQDDQPDHGAPEPPVGRSHRIGGRADPGQLHQRQQGEHRDHDTGESAVGGERTANPKGSGRVLLVERIENGQN